MWVCFAGGPAQRVSSLATKRRGGRGGPRQVWWQGSSTRTAPASTDPSGVSHPPAPADLGPQQATKLCKLQKRPPPAPQPTPTPQGKPAQRKKGHQERNALHGIVCPDQRPPAKIKELAAFSDPTSSFFLSTMHAAAVADCCSCPLNSPLEPSHRACCSLPRRHRLHPVAINIDIVSSARPDDDDRLTLWFFRPPAMK